MIDFRYGANPSLIGALQADYQAEPTSLADCGLAYVEQPHPRERAYELARAHLAKKSPDAVSPARGVTTTDRRSA